MSKSVTGITQRNKRSIREIKRQRRESDSSHQGGGGDNGNGRQSFQEQQPPGRHDSERAATFGLWFVGVVGILFLFFLFSVIFAETTVTVYPQTADISVDDTYTASNDDGIPYSVVSAEESVELTASTTGSEYREETASGEITIYNNYSSESIRLVPNTRFETSDGLIYRTQEAVVVPGQSSEDEPGTVIATVVADEPGSDYNKTNVDLSIPGFAGTAYEDEVYAESSEALSGGIAGNVPIVSSSTRQSLEETAADQLRDELSGQVREDLPEGFVLYENGKFFSTNISASTSTATTSTALTVTGQMQAVVFDGKQLSTNLATAYSDDISPEDNIRIQNLDDFNFEIIDRSSFNPAEDDSFEFNLSGDSQIVWQYDERALVRDLRGLQKDRLNDVLVNYNGIQEAEVITRPFWKQTLPEEAAEITINTVNN